MHVFYSFKYFFETETFRNFYLYFCFESFYQKKPAKSRKGDISSDEDTGDVSEANRKQKTNPQNLIIKAKNSSIAA